MSKTPEFLFRKERKSLSCKKDIYLWKDENVDCPSHKEATEEKHEKLRVFLPGLILQKVLAHGLSLHFFVRCRP